MRGDSSVIFSGDQLDRYSRHFVLREIGVSGQKKLLASKVLVIGAGAFGSASLMYLAASGVGTIGVADYDCVELSNLQRQIIHRTENIGKRKTDSALMTMKEINPDISVNLHPAQVSTDNIEKLIRPYDFIIDGTDRFETKFLINDACVLSKKPYSHAGAVKYLLGIGELLSGRILALDALSMDIRIVRMEKSDPHCRVCGEAPDILSVTDNREDYEIHGCAISGGECK